MVYDFYLNFSKDVEKKSVVIKHSLDNSKMSFLLIYWNRVKILINIPSLRIK